MISDEAGLHLHNRKTKGETLTPEEKSQLADWYAVQDDQEDSLINSQIASSQHTSVDVAQMQEQSRSALHHLTATTQRIQEITAENEILREEILALKTQLIMAKSA